MTGQLGRRRTTAWRTVLRSSLLVVALTTTVVACGSTDPGDGAAHQTTSIGTAVPEALRFTAPLVGGGEFDGVDVAGRPVAFWFWAPT